MERMQPILWGGTGVSETPASRTFYSRFPPPSLGVPASLLCVDGKMLRNIAKFFFFSPGFPPLWESRFPPFLLPPPVPLPSLFSRAPAPLSPPPQYWPSVVSAVCLAGSASLCRKNGGTICKIQLGISLAHCFFTVYVLLVCSIIWPLGPWIP